MIDYDIFIDFDRTMYDSDRLYREIYLICENYGLKRSILEESYNKYFQEPVLFNVISLIKYAAQEVGILAGELLQSITDLILFKGNNFVYKDVFNTLGYLTETSNSIRLITYGDVLFQEMKINGSGLKDQFKDIIITNQYKWLHENLSKNSKKIIIDDNPREISKYRYYYDSAILIEVKRVNTKYYNKISGSADIVINDMNWINIKKQLDNKFYMNMNHSIDNIR